MKQACNLMLTLLSISGISLAQERANPNNAEKIFGIQPYTMERAFQINLGKGNRLLLEVSDISSLKSFSNMDSLLQVFLLDLVPLRDSLSDPISTKRIDYVIDTSGNKKIRIQQFRPLGENFLLQEGSISALKLDQDTIFISGLIRNIDASRKTKAFFYYRLKIFINQAMELSTYIDGGLNEKMKEIEANINTHWQPWNNANYSLRSDYSQITDYSLRSDTSVFMRKFGGPQFRGGSYISTYIATNIQNYKNYFVPSVSLGLAIGLNNRLTTHLIGAYWEPQFLFVKNQMNNNLSTYRNDFITVFYKLGYTQNRFPRKVRFVHFHPFVSLGYLYHQEGQLYYNHSFRLGLGFLSLLKGSASIEPVLYFHDLFREVTPGLKLVVRFN